MRITNRRIKRGIVIWKRTSEYSVRRRPNTRNTGDRIPLSPISDRLSRVQSVCQTYTWNFTSDLEDWTVSGGSPSWSSTFGGSVLLDPATGFAGIKVSAQSVSTRLGLSLPIDASRLRYTIVADTNGLSGSWVMNVDADGVLNTHTMSTANYSNHTEHYTIGNISNDFSFFSVHTLTQPLYIRLARVALLCNPPATATATVNPGTATAIASATAGAGTAAATATALAGGPGQQPIPGGGSEGPPVLGAIVVDDGVSVTVPLHPCVIVDYKDTELVCNYEAIPAFTLTGWYRWLSGWGFYLVCQVANLFKPLLWLYDIVRTMFYSSMYGMCNARVLFENVNGIKNDISTNIISYVGFLGDLYELEADEDIGLGCNISTFRVTLKNFITGSVYISPIWTTLIHLLSFSILVSGLRMLVSSSFESIYGHNGPLSKR